MSLTQQAALIDIGRVGVLIITLLYASKLDINDRKVPHRTWVLPILIGIVFILAQTIQTVESQPLIIAYGLIGVISLGSIALSAKQLYNNTTINQATWAIPILTTLTLLSVHLLIFSSSQVTNTLLLTILSNIGLAILLGLFLHLFPNIGMGGADFVALVTIGFLLPVYPELGPLPYLTTPDVPFPDALITLPVMNVITNTAFIALLYLPFLPVKNVLLNETDKPFLTAFTTEVPLDELHTTHGRVIPTWKFEDASTMERFKLYFSGLDTFFLREYFEWRQTVSSENPQSFADENSIYLQRFLDNHRELFDYDEDEGWDTKTFDADEEFMEQLLEQDSVRLMPGIPFIVPMFVGVLLLLTVGDILYIVLLAMNGMLF